MELKFCGGGGQKTHEEEEERKLEKREKVSCAFILFQKSKSTLHLLDSHWLINDDS